MGGPAIINDIAYYEFDNFNMKYPFQYNGVEWMSTEQLYQAMKFADKDYREYIRKQRDPHLIYMLGQDRTKATTDGFPDNKVDNMYIAMRTRIMYHPELQTLLRDTLGNITFPGSDEFWGTDCGEGGKNWNGQLLERIRCELIDMNI